MDRTKLKNYAPQARRDFIRAVTDKAAVYGLSTEKLEPVTGGRDVAIIGGRAFPASVVAKRKALEQRIERNGFAQTMEALAYTWFNRFVAIRFMELHGYLDHGYRVLSNPDAAKPIPEILDHAEHVDLQGLKKDKVIELKLDGSKESELYQMLLVAQCNALHSAMPFLFERIDDETELVLPGNLLHSDSIIRKLVTEIEEEDWREVEIIGWLYQFYISEKKDQVIGKVVASADIPAATQLFTPNWIVKYLVQNTIGRQWLSTYPQSPLRQQMQYYIEPAEQASEVQEKLRTITPTRLNPEELTLLDPACGSGHILVEAYDLFKAIYQERGYRAKDIPALILQKNLFGLEIDDRAAQLAAFALMMKARADDRRIFDSGTKPNILAFQESREMNATEITGALNSPINKGDLPREYLFQEIEEEKAGLFSRKALAEKGHVSPGDIVSLLELFENAKTFGSLIQIPPTLVSKLSEIEDRLNDVLQHGDLTHASVHVIMPLIQQAKLLARQYDVVVANPPYMGSSFMNGTLKSFIGKAWKDCKADLFAAFVSRFSSLVHRAGFIGVMTPFTWMFLSSYEKFRHWMLAEMWLTSLIQPEYHAFFDSAYVPICAYTLQNAPIRGRSDFIGLSEFYGESVQSIKALEAISNRNCGWRYRVSTTEFAKIPGCPIAFSASGKVRRVFERATKLGEVAEPRLGMATGDNDRYIRLWFEVAVDKIGFGCASREEAAATKRKWFPYHKGGDYRRWFGNQEYVVNWENDGLALQTTLHPSGDRVWAHNFNLDYIFKPCVVWSRLSSSFFGVRISDKGFLFDSAGCAAFTDNAAMPRVLGFMCSKLVSLFTAPLNPTLAFQPGDVANLPYLKEAIGLNTDAINDAVGKCIALAKEDWNLMETSWDFRGSGIITASSAGLLEADYQSWSLSCTKRLEDMKAYEERNNAIYANIYDLSEEISPDMPDDQITLYRSERKEDIERLLSYVIGCIMGRYSLDKPGLIYASSGNEGFDPSQYKTFGADTDGIIPLLDADWGVPADAANRIVEFVGFAWPKEHLEENVKFIADSLGPTGNEHPRKTIRRYLATGFYKHHLSTYKKRPIYWLFSSGKQRAFQCLIYLHRYHAGTLARMRTEYVIPLQGKLVSRIDLLASDIQNATATSHRKRLEKERDTLLKQQAELKLFDEQLRHYADLRIKLDLDDGVKVNYGKFGDLLAEVKAVTGGSND